MADNVDIQLLGKRVADLTTEVRVLDRAVQRMSVEMQATLASFRHEMLTGFDRTQISFEEALNKVAAENAETLTLIVRRFDEVNERHDLLRKEMDAGFNSVLQAIAAMRG